MASAPYQDRTVRVEARITRQRATFVITDEGVGFETRLVPNPARPETLENAAGRGLVLIQTFMDSVAHNPAGNEIRWSSTGPAGAVPWRRLSAPRWPTIRVSLSRPPCGPLVLSSGASLAGAGFSSSSRHRPQARG
ncbi:MAG: ATP-binding protein [Planctomycetaceae bacterium]